MKRYNLVEKIAQQETIYTCTHIYALLWMYILLLIITIINYNKSIYAALDHLKLFLGVCLHAYIHVPGSNNVYFTYPTV